VQKGQQGCRRKLRTNTDNSIDVPRLSGKWHRSAFPERGLVKNRNPIGLEKLESRLK
jgi:hypothetical protein